MQPTDNKIELYKQLIDGCKKNNRESQKKMYDLLSSKMFGVCLRYVKDREIAEDLLQEGFVKIFTNIEKFRGEGSFEGWARRIFVNTAIEAYRKSTKMYPIVNLEIAEHFEGELVYNDTLELEDLMKLIHGYWFWL